MYDTRSRVLLLRVNETTTIHAVFFNSKKLHVYYDLRCIPNSLIKYSYSTVMVFYIRLINSSHSTIEQRSLVYTKDCTNQANKKKNKSQT